MLMTSKAVTLKFFEEICMKFLKLYTQSWPVERVEQIVLQKDITRVTLEKLGQKFPKRCQQDHDFTFCNPRNKQIALKKGMQ